MARTKQTAKKSKPVSDPDKKDKKDKKKKRRYKPGTVALRQIRHYQKRWELLVPRAPLTRVVREILQEINPELRIQRAALEALQESAEVHLTTLFHDANSLAIHAKRVTIMPKDMKLVQQVKE